MSQTKSRKVFSAKDARVDVHSVAPLPNSEKIYVTGSRDDMRVPMRKISQAVTPTDMGGEENPPIRKRLQPVPQYEPDGPDA